METFLQLLVTGNMVGAIYALMALGIVMIYKATKVFNFAQAWMVILGAYFF